MISVSRETSETRRSPISPRGQQRPQSIGGQIGHQTVAERVGMKAVGQEHIAPDRTVAGFEQGVEIDALN